MKHTPGPWTIVDSYEAPEIHGNGIRICNMTHGAHGQTPEGKANTKLISEAPLMLEILQELVKDHEAETRDTNKEFDTYWNAKQLIQKLEK